MTELDALGASEHRKVWKRIVIEVLDDRVSAGVEVLRQAGTRRKKRTTPFQETFVVVREGGEVDTVLLDLEELAGAAPLSVLRIATLPD
jgi:hypothetical protein